ncbi:diaminopimelate decarboxylase [Candidatus Vidania fulgoroideorum]
MIKKIIKKYKKPIFIYSIKKIIKNIKKLKKHKKIKIFYAIKSNYNKKIIKKMNNYIEGFEVVSKGEIKFLIKLGINTKKIIYSGVCKKKKEINYAIRKKISKISIESYDELKKIKGKIKIILKYNLNLDGETKPEITTCKENNKFGIRKRETKKIIKHIKKKKIKIYALGFHIGSQIKKTKFYIKAINIIKTIIKKYKKKKINIKNIDIGGGYALNYKNNKTEKYKKLIKFIKKDNEYKSYILEPGRYLIANSCLTISKVIYIKKSKKKKIAITDIGMESIIRPALYKSFHSIKNFYKRKEKKIFDIVGPICESTDLFVKNNYFDIKIGDFLIIKDTGAYCLSMRSIYNMRDKPKELLIVKKKIIKV